MGTRGQIDQQGTTSRESTEPTISERTDTATQADQLTAGTSAVMTAADGTAVDDTAPSATATADTATAGTTTAGTTTGENVTHPRRRPRPAGAAWRLARRVPAVVLVITALHLALLATYSVAYPTWTGYDEAQHVDMVYGLLHGDGWPAPGDKMISKGIAATSDAFDRGAYADMFQSGGKKRGSPSFAEITPTPRSARESFDALGGPAPVTDGRLSNQMVQHPPMVYAVGAAVLGALPASHWAYDQQVYVLRLLNILLVAPLPLLAWATARRLRLPEVVARGAAVLPLAVPGFDRVGATFNNDGVLMLTTGVLTFVLAGVLRGDRRIRTAGWAGLWLALTLLSKGLALLMPLMVVAAYLVGWWNTTRRDASLTDAGRGGARGGWARALVGSLPWRPAIVSLAVGLAVGGWWWVRNVIRYGAVQPNGWDTDPPRREALLLPDSFWTWLWYFVRTMIDRFWAGLGMFEPPQLTPVAIVAATVVVGVVGAACLLRGLGPESSGRRPAIPDQAARAAALDPASGLTASNSTASHPAASPAARPAARRRLPSRAAWVDWLGRPAVPVVLLLPVAFAYVTVGERSWAEYAIYTRGIAVQGRYLYLGLVGAGVVIAAGLARLLGRRARWTTVALLAGAVLMQAFALLAICTYYWLGRGVHFTPARVPDVAAAIARWAPFPCGVTYAILSVTAALVLAALAITIRAALRTGGPTPPAASDGPRSAPETASPLPDAAPMPSPAATTA